jgi:hypothetical protein
MGNHKSAQKILKKPEAWALTWRACENSSLIKISAENGIPAMV